MTICRVSGSLGIVTNRVDDCAREDVEWLVGRTDAECEEQVQKIVAGARRRVGAQDVLNLPLFRLWMPLVHLFERVLNDLSRRSARKEG